MNSINKFKNVLFLSIVFILVFVGCTNKVTTYDYSSYQKTTSGSQMINTNIMQRATMRPYTVLGQNYTPEIKHIGYTTTGIASWYGPDFHSKKTSNGEIYNMHDLTAAHKTFPMNTVVRVDNLENGKSITVRINDRGPFVKDRIIDLSNKAAHDIDMVQKGTARVKLTILGYNGIVNSDYNPNGSGPVLLENNRQSINEDLVDIKDSNLITDDTTFETEDFPSEESIPAGNINIASVSSINTNTTNTKTTSGTYSIQVGAFSLINGAEKTKKTYQKKFPYKKIYISKKGKLNIVLLKGFNSYEEAKKFKDNNNLSSSIIVKE